MIDQKKALPGSSPTGVAAIRLPRGVYNNFAFEFVNAIMWQSFGSPVILFVRQSGASAFIVGALSAIPLLLMPLTLLSSGLVERWGYRRTALISWTLRWLFCSSLIAIALVDWPGFDLWRVPLCLLVVLLFHLCRNFGVSANVAWQTAIVPPLRRGLFLSRTTLFANLGSVIAFFTIGLLLGNSPTLAQFAPVFVLGVLGGAFSSGFMARIQPPPVTVPRPLQNRPRRGFGQGFARCFARVGFLNFIAVQTFYGAAFFAIPSLSLIYLREKVHIPAGTISFFSMGGVAGATLAALVWGGWIDRRGINSLQLLAFLGLSFNSVLWFCIGLMGSEAVNLIVAALVSFLSAVWVCALNMSQSHAIMSLAPDEDRVMFQNVATLMAMCSQALAPMLWGSPTGRPRPRSL